MIKYKKYRIYVKSEQKEPSSDPVENPGSYEFEKQRNFINSDTVLPTNAQIVKVPKGTENIIIVEE